jgi:hypothetical protein
MFVQMITGRVDDVEALRRQVDRWNDEVRPGATGFLGSTAGVTSKGDVMAFIRFESEAAARANDERTEQSEWWAETEKCYVGDVAFREFTDVETILDGGSDDAGFVQVMQFRVTDRARLRELEQGMLDEMRTARPDVIGALRMWDGDRSVQVVYFTSEAEARSGEQKEMPGDDDALEALLTDIEYDDISDPWLTSA